MFGGDSGRGSSYRIYTACPLVKDWSMIHPMIEHLIGGCVCLGFSIWIFLISGYKNAARQSGAVSKWLAERYRRNASTMWVFGLLFGFFAVGLARQGLVKLERRQEHGITDLVAGLTGVMIAAYLLFHRKKLSSSSADWQEYYGEFLRRNPWILLIVGIMSGLFGILLICTALAKPL